MSPVESYISGRWVNLRVAGIGAEADLAGDVSQVLTEYMRIEIK
jgi:hypothetical protein